MGWCFGCETYQLRVEFGQARLPVVVEDQHRVDHSSLAPGGVCPEYAWNSRNLVLWWAIAGLRHLGVEKLPRLEARCRARLLAMIRW